jgi:hypothetical protein
MTVVVRADPQVVVVPTGVTGSQGPPGPAGSGSTIGVKDEGSLLSTTVQRINFTGAGVSVSGSGADVTANIPGGGGGAEVNIADYLSVSRTPFVTDDLAAFNSAAGDLAALGGGRLNIPSGKYYCSAAVNFNCQVHIVGAGSGQNAKTSGLGTTTILFAVNVNGFVFNHFNTVDNTTKTASALAASGSCIEGVALWGGNVTVDGSGNVTSFNAGTSTSGHGIRYRTDFVTSIDVWAQYFGGHGFYNHATGGSGGSTEGNANSNLFIACQGQYNRGDGFHFEGNDANACGVYNCSAIYNGGAGFRDYSFLGNAFRDCHCRDNGVDDPTVAGTATISGGPTGTCQYPAASGVYYYVVAGQETAASTTTPGTNTAVWKTFVGHPYCKTWQTGLTWVSASPYMTNPANANCRNCVFDNCYAEYSQAPSQIFNPARVEGGLMGEVGLSPNSTASRGSNEVDNTRTFTGAVATVDRAGGTLRSAVLGEGGSNLVHSSYYDTVGTWRWKGSSSPGNYFLDYNNSLVPVIGVWGSYLGWTRAACLATPVISDSSGDTNAGRVICFINSSSDLNGKTLTQGEIYFLKAPTAGGKIGYVCTGSGTGGSSATLKQFGVIDA